MVHETEECTSVIRTREASGDLMETVEKAIEKHGGKSWSGKEGVIVITVAKW